MARKKIEPIYPDPDDMFSDTRMSMGDHIEDLRSHLLRAVYGFLIGLVLALFVGKQVVRFIAAPVERQLMVYYNNYYNEKERELRAEALRNPQQHQVKIPIKMRFPAAMVPLEVVPADKRPKDSFFKQEQAEIGRIIRDLEMEPFVDNYWKLDDDKWVSVDVQLEKADDLFWHMSRQTRMVKPPGLSTLNVQEAFLVYFKVSLVTGLVISSPWVFYQIWAFIAAGLYPHEKKLVNIYLPVSLGLFLVGVALCQFVVLPKAIEALLWFNEWLGLQPDLRLSEWLSFAIFMPLVFGISFQTPMVMLFTFRLGIFEVQQFREKRRLAWFLMAIFAAVITPSTDAFSMLFLWIPLSLLYEMGIWLCAIQPKPVWDDEEESETGELVEV